MENKLNLIERFYTLLQKIVSTKFGSAVVGFTLAGLIAYYSFMQRCTEHNHSLQSELFDLRKVNDSLIHKMVHIREEEREKAVAEARDYFDYIYDYNQKMQEQLRKNNALKESEIKRIEEQIKREKGL